MEQDVVVSLNKIIMEYDQLMICGPVFPHEVVGFSGGAKYLFPGISGPEITNASHWLGALAGVVNTIGKKNTPVRALINNAAQKITGLNGKDVINKRYEENYRGTKDKKSSLLTTLKENKVFVNEEKSSLYNPNPVIVLTRGLTFFTVNLIVISLPSVLFPIT